MFYFTFDICNLKFLYFSFNYPKFFILILIFGIFFKKNPDVSSDLKNIEISFVFLLHPLSHRIFNKKAGHQNITANETTTGAASNTITTANTAINNNNNINNLYCYII